MIKRHYPNTPFILKNPTDNSFLSSIGRYSSRYHLSSLPTFIKKGDSLFSLTWRTANGTLIPESNLQASSANFLCISTTHTLSRKKSDLILLRTVLFFLLFLFILPEPDPFCNTAVKSVSATTAKPWSFVLLLFTVGAAAADSQISGRSTNYSLSSIHGLSC
ncbi:hypothetical protein ADIAL_1437 [Alkalibacterium sp. AK22]|nr:hypothetical protein ADIAL_1437 [Alkalibacterium sp. AK22]